ncbi:MAG: hypothetical protein OXC99_04090 [Chloroflexi bacterium]|nr:hypothetical protein [Chloroflexota bacterium]
MPNGGSDCCGTCWYNRVNEGTAGYERSGVGKGIKDHCEIRGLAIETPFYTYCANHPHHMPEGGPVPVGPVFTGDSNGNRKVWVESPDTEEVRLALLNMLDGLAHVVSRDRYPFTSPGIAQVVVGQLMGFREQRAAPVLQRLLERWPESELFQEALREITNERED